MLRKISAGYMTFINWFNGLCAFVCGIAMMIGLMDAVMPVSIFDPFPFHDVFFTGLFWPGLALLLVNGVANLAACACKIRRNTRGWKMCNLVASVLLLLWTGAEMLLIPNGVSVFYMILGVLQLLATLYVMNTHAE